MFMLKQEMSRLEGSKILPAGKGVLRGEYELDPRSKSFRTRSASGLELRAGLTVALKGL